MKRMVWAAILVCVFLCGAGACAEPARFTLPVADTSVEIRAALLETEEEQTQWLFLPAFADADSLGLSWLDEEADAEGVRRAEWNGEILHVMQSQNLRALFLFSDDPVNQGREYIDDAPKAEKAETTGVMALIAPDGTLDHADRLRQLRGRGNNTWYQEKKPYQFKLENRAELLKTGESDECARTWVLLAEHLDSTMLHNKILLDLALELGMEETSQSEFVDLYYDGEYRGLYLLAEKVEIDEARINEMDYDRLIEMWSAQTGVIDPETLPVSEGRNRFGNRYIYIQDLQDSGMVNAGAYLLEMEDAVGTLSDRCWFEMSDGSVIALKNPQNASDSMARYISEKLEEARRVLLNGGVSEDGTLSIEDVFDVDAFALEAVLCELGYSCDSFRYSSTFFVLPAESDRFEPGPLWDLDQGLRYFRNGINDDGIGVITREGWLPEFYSVPAFAQRMRDIYLNQVYPLVRDVLLGGGSGKYLQNLESCAALIETAKRMNDKLWEPAQYAWLEYANDTRGEMSMLRSFLEERSQWLWHAMQNMQPDSVTLWGYAAYTGLPDEVQVYTCPWDKGEVRSVAVEQLTEATEENYALWQMEIVIEPKEGHAFQNPQVWFGEVPLACEMQEDGSLLARVTFEDESYRPVDYYGDDIGLVYNPDAYAANYPEIAAEYGDDPEALMEYFCDEGMYEGHMGNAFFKPGEVLFYHYELRGTHGEDWPLYYWDFIEYGWEQGWIQNVQGEKPGFALHVKDAL